MNYQKSTEISCNKIIFKAYFAILKNPIIIFQIQKNTYGFSDTALY